MQLNIYICIIVFKLLKFDIYFVEIMFLCFFNNEIVMFDMLTFDILFCCMFSFLF